MSTNFFSRILRLFLCTYEYVKNVYVYEYDPQQPHLSYNVFSLQLLKIQPPPPAPTPYSHIRTASSQYNYEGSQFLQREGKGESGDWGPGHSGHTVLQLVRIKSDVLSLIKEKKFLIYSIRKSMVKIFVHFLIYYEAPPHI
jgi:hypothetical protein